MIVTQIPSSGNTLFSVILSETKDIKFDMDRRFFTLLRTFRKTPGLVFLSTSVPLSPSRASGRRAMPRRQIRKTNNKTTS